MKIRESIVFVLLAAGIVAVFGGFAIVSRGESLGWLGVLLAVPMLYIAQRSMRAGRAALTSAPDESRSES